MSEAFSVVFDYPAYVRSVAGCSSLAGLESAFHEALRRLGVEVFNYGAGHIRGAEGPVADRLWSTMNPAWIKKYRERQYYRSDRLVAAAFARMSPFTFSEIFSTAPEREDQAEMEREFPYQHGIVFPYHSPLGRFGILSAVLDRSVDYENASSFSLIASLNLVATITHDRAERLASREAERAAGLTTRETDCLRWAVCGKTSEEIALILGITERTVRKHMTATMEKLGAKSRAQAVGKAIALGIASTSHIG